ncbi:MAG: DUF167 domain-containing protein [Candidatus Bathyarchaeia archaeon]
MRYEVEVKFHDDFIKVEGNKIVVGLTSKPERGKANLELIKKLAKHFNVPSTQVKIIAGLKSKRKIVEVKQSNSC